MRLAEMMKKRRLSGRLLAKRSGVHYVQIMGYLRADPKQGKFPSLQNLTALARALNCTLEELTGLESLRGIEKKIEKPELSERALEFAHLYNGLSDDTAKELIQDMILKAAERETKKKGGASDKRK